MTIDVEELEPAAYFVPISLLRPWKDNPRDNDHAVPEVADSIKRFGFANVITGRVVNHEYVEVLAGHTRLKASIKLGLTQVPVRLMDFDPVDGHLFALADNKKGELANWSDGLSEVLKDFEDGVDLTGLGWDDAELEAIMDPADIDSVQWKTFDETIAPAPPPANPAAPQQPATPPEQQPAGPATPPAAPRTVCCPACSHEFTL